MPHDILRICHAALANHGALFMTLFVGGLVGSVSHCAGMCGPFVLSQTATLLDDKPLASISDLSRLRGAALIPYHAGRMTTYALLGMSATLLSAPLRSEPWFDELSALFLVIAGMIFILSAFPKLAARLTFAKAFPSRLSLSLRSFFAHPRGWRGYVLGLALGFLPCGLVYAAIFSVAAHGETLTAAFGMIVFALGTIPILVAVGVGGQFAFLKFRSGLRFALPVLMMLNSLALFAMAGELIK